MQFKKKVKVNSLNVKIYFMYKCGIHVVNSPAEIGKKVAEVMKK
jgi:succinyl-CoA synthetase alpha subunit